MNEVKDNEEQFVEVKTREINSNFYNYFYCDCMLFLVSFSALYSLFSAKY